MVVVGFRFWCFDDRCSQDFHRNSGCCRRLLLLLGTTQGSRAVAVAVRVADAGVLSGVSVSPVRLWFCFRFLRRPTTATGIRTGRSGDAVVEGMDTCALAGGGCRCWAGDGAGADADAADGANADAADGANADAADGGGSDPNEVPL